MGKPIKLTREYIEAACKEFESVMTSAKMFDGRFSYTKTFTSSTEKTTVYFTAEAWAKMVALIHAFSDEVAWHGIAHRSEAPAGYIISDILVYPQEVTGATVNTDQEKYQSWLMAHDDEVFNNIRMQGHSHVNMGTSPSTVDTTHQERILDQLDDSMFYIFMIWNKRFEHTTKVYDLQKNMLYEQGDVEIKLLGANSSLSGFIEEAKSMVSRKVVAYTGTPYNTGASPKSYGGTPAATTTPSAYNPVSTPTKQEKQKTTVSGFPYQNSLYEGYGDDWYEQYKKY